MDPNDLLAEIHTNKEGEFTLYGEEDEVGKIEPFIRIHHSCKAKKVASFTTRCTSSYITARIMQ